jgi:hypothetical protein
VLSERHRLNGECQGTVEMARGPIEECVFQTLRKSYNRRPTPPTATETGQSIEKTSDMVAAPYLFAADFEALDERAFTRQQHQDRLPARS